ncbi:hypothetical protein BDP27DRAFT_1351928 [Rhodocollybia butyracea]|uniref:Uncharacterized protein n=1 Tax=Rhodocollybia butyracea TaxID=206335 RepID=A0A9P5P3M3_9AGAR|nr:hypothetical protein BDP27DRAFT_1351928 [Rhodocollybia butyracea]
MRSFQLMGTYPTTVKYAHPHPIARHCLSHLNLLLSLSLLCGCCLVLFSQLCSFFFPTTAPHVSLQYTLLPSSCVSIVAVMPIIDSR